MQEQAMQPEACHNPSQKEEHEITSQYKQGHSAQSEPEPEEIAALMRITVEISDREMTDNDAEKTHQ